MIISRSYIFALINNQINRLDKDELRRVSYTINDQSFQGYFHKWMIKKDEQGNESAVALIENLHAGNMVEIPSGNMIFEDSSLIK